MEEPVKETSKIKKGTVSLILLGLTVLITLALGNSIVETVEKGTYQIKQAAITGEMTAHMTPGMYCQCFGDIQIWPKAFTKFFTADKEEGTEDSHEDHSISVRFNDGSTARISGTMRVGLPHLDERAIELITSFGFQGVDDVSEKLIKPILRNALRNTANLMSARESYAEKRNQFVSWAWDQIQHGMYRTKARREVVRDPTTGEEVTKVFNEIMFDKKTGMPIREQNPMHGMGLTVSNFEIKDFIYSGKVRDQIQQQQENIMAIETAKAEALKAEQQEKTAEMKGKAAVTKAQYEKEEEKIRAVVDAKKEKEVAELRAHKELEVAKLQKKAAVEQKQREILLGQGESERKKLIMKADGALARKLEAWKEVNFRYAEAIEKYKGQWVPTVVMGKDNSKSSNGAQDLINMLSVKTARELALDMKIKGN